MKKRLIILDEIIRGGHTDVFRTIDYKKIVDEVDDFLGGVQTNSGNKVWFQGLISLLSNGENEISFKDRSMTWDYVNQSFDAIIISTANAISVTEKNYLRHLVKVVKKCEKPVFVISVGAQADTYDDIEELCACVKDEVKKLVKAVYDTGGEFVLRGYFTKEVMDRIVSNTAFVGGCPSLYQNGRSLYIENPSNCEKPIFNSGLSYGKIHPCLIGWMEKSNSGIFIDQDHWFRSIYSPKNWTLNTYERIMKKPLDNYSDEALIKLIEMLEGPIMAKFYMGNRIKLFYDIPHWRKYLTENGFDFSIGSRIHGNIMSLLSNIPAMTIPFDSRVREMSEFYGIPMFKDYNKENVDLEEVVEMCDYTKFNKTFGKLYDDFENFLVEHGLVDNINPNNIFWERQNAES